MNRDTYVNFCDNRLRTCFIICTIAEAGTATGESTHLIDKGFQSGLWCRAPAKQPETPKTVRHAANLRHPGSQKAHPMAVNPSVPDFVRFILRKRTDNEIRDTSLLPWPKQGMIDTCLQYLEQTNNPHIRQTVGDALLYLSFYQDGVGADPMRNCRFDLFPMDITSLGSDLEGLKKAVALELPHLETDKFIDLLIKVQEDFKSLNASCEAIEAKWASLDNP
jgi:hypothetical protein